MSSSGARQLFVGIAMQWREARVGRRVSGARCRGAVRLRSGAAPDARGEREAKATPEAGPAGVQKKL